MTFCDIVTFYVILIILHSLLNPWYKPKFTFYVWISLGTPFKQAVHRGPSVYGFCRF